MLDIGWPELMVIAAITVVVVGPREIPRVLRTVNGYVRKARSLASEFQSSMEDMARDADLEDLKKQMKSTGDEFSGDFEKSIDPTGDVKNSMRELKDSMNERYSSESARAPSNSVKPPADEPKDDAPKSESSSTQDKSGEPKPAEPKAAPAKKAAAKKGGAKKTAAKTAAKKAGAKKAASKKTAAKKPESGGGTA